MVYKEDGTIKYEVGDWIYVLEDGFNDSGNKEYKSTNPAAKKDDVLRIVKFVPQSSNNILNCAVGDMGQVVYIDQYKKKFRPATEDEIKNYKKPIMLGVYPVVFKREFGKIETESISVGCITVSKDKFYEVGREAGWLP